VTRVADRPATTPHALDAGSEARPRLAGRGSVRAGLGANHSWYREIPAGRPREIGRVPELLREELRAREPRPVTDPMMGHWCCCTGGCVADGAAALSLASSRRRRGLRRAASPARVGDPSERRRSCSAARLLLAQLGDELIQLRDIAASSLSGPSHTAASFDPFNPPGACSCLARGRADEVQQGERWPQRALTVIYKSGASRHAFIIIQRQANASRSELHGWPRQFCSIS